MKNPSGTGLVMRWRMRLNTFLARKKERHIIHNIFVGDKIIDSHAVGLDIPEFLCFIMNRLRLLIVVHDEIHLCLSIKMPLKLTYWCREKFVSSVLHITVTSMASEITGLAIGCTAVYSRPRSKKTSKLCITGLCEGYSPVSGEFPA